MREEAGKKLHGLGEFYTIYMLAMYSMVDFAKTKRKDILSDHFVERIMLSVTEVNGCAYCSYAHTKMALEAGMTNQEIQKMLAGQSDEVPEAELSAVMFAQHYADSRGKPSADSLKQVEKIYGPEKTKGILASIRIMMFGNVAGIAWGSLVNRFKKNGEVDPRSNIVYEIALALTTLIYLPFALVHGLLLRLLKIKKDPF